MAKAINIRTGQTWNSGESIQDAPEQLYKSFEEFLQKVSQQDIRKWCQSKASKANKPRLLSKPPKFKVTAQMVMDVLFAAKGLCCYCGGLCVEKAPVVNGNLAPWAHVGRRIGSLEHTVRLIDGGDNTVNNFEWCCNWCNTWPDQRTYGATDHGGIQDNDAKPNTYQMANAIIVEIKRVFPNDFEGTTEEYQWLQKTYSISEEEEVYWQLILEYLNDELSDQDEADQELLKFLEDKEEVDKFLFTLLEKYRSCNEPYNG